MKYNQFYNLGYQIFPNILDNLQVSHLKSKLDEVHALQVSEFGEERLLLIGESDTVRAPFLYDDCFINLFSGMFANTITKEILGDHRILSLQNAIMVKAKSSHHQSFYHRDIIHQNFTSSTPLAINLYYCLDDYNLETGGTHFLARSHKMDHLPTNQEPVVPNISAGSVILFDSMIYHKSGVNSSNFDRYGINNMFTLPFIKQQIDYSSIIKKKTSNADLNQLLGFYSREFDGVNDFRKYRFEKLSNDK